MLTPSQMANPKPLDCCAAYSKDVLAYEREGMTTSDAQACADAEHKKIHAMSPDMFHCPVCHSSFLKPKGLREHFRKHHPKAKEE